MKKSLIAFFLLWDLVHASCLTVFTPSVLSEFDPILTSTIPPEAEVLSQFKFESLLSKGRIMKDPIINEFLMPSAREQVQRVFDATPPNSTYVFVGNGMYPIYVFSKGLTQGTPVHRRIHFLAFSGDLVRSLENQREASHRYFKLAGLGSPPEGPIVVIDTITAGSKKVGAHQIQIVAREIQKFAQDSFKKKIAVIPVGIPEGARGNPRLMRSTWQEVVRTELLSPSNYLILDLGLPLETNIFNPFSYFAPRWNGDLGSKFDLFGKDGRPASRDDPVLKLVEEGAGSFNLYPAIMARMEFLYNMKLIFEYAQRP